MKKWVFALMLITFAARAGAYSIPYESWMGTFVGDKKVGYLQLKIDKAEFNGIKGYRITTVFQNHLTVLGADMTQVVHTVAYTDDKYAPLKEDFSMSSGGKTTEVSSEFKKNSVECVVSAGSGSSTKSVPIPEGANLVADPLFSTSDTFPEIGKEYNLHYFNPLMLSVDDLKIKVERREKLTVGGKDYDTVVLQNITPMGDMVVWQTAAGEVVQIKGMMGINMIRMPKDEAMTGIDGGTSEDFAVLTSVKPDRAIPHPRDISALDITLSSITDPQMMITDTRQKATEDKDKPGDVRFEIKAQRFDSRKSADLPFADASLAPYLTSTPYVDCSMSSVTDQAKAIVGDEKNAYAACAKIRAWIYRNLQAKADIGITRSASDVLQSRVGVCRDYAILFAALARSAHIPSKVVSGLIFTDGAFYYHAWVECYVGKWIPFDATLPSDFVDATHVKLAEGDATTMFGLAKVIGTLKVQVKSYK